MCDMGSITLGVLFLFVVGWITVALVLHYAEEENDANGANDPLGRPRPRKGVDPWARLYLPKANDE